MDITSTVADHLVAGSASTKMIPTIARMSPAVAPVVKATVVSVSWDAYARTPAYLLKFTGVIAGTPAATCSDLVVNQAVSSTHSLGSAAVCAVVADADGANTMLRVTPSAAGFTIVHGDYINVVAVPAGITGAAYNPMLANKGVLLPKSTPLAAELDNDGTNDMIIVNLPVGAQFYGAPAAAPKTTDIISITDPSGVEVVKLAAALGTGATASVGTGADANRLKIVLGAGHTITTGEWNNHWLKLLLDLRLD